VRIGISICSAYPLDADAGPRLGAQNMIERAAAAEAAGLDSLFIGDHHVTAQPYYQNSPMLGRMLAEWGSNPAGALYLLPLWNPVLLAEQVATLACLTQGRFILQCGLGGDRQQSEGMGVDLRYRPSMFEQSLDAMRRLWRGETVDLDGRWQLRGARISPLPPEPIEVWIGANAPVAINRAARLGEAWLGGPNLTLQQAAESLNVYKQACAEHDHEATTVAIRRDIYVGASAAEAERVMAPYIEGGYRGFSSEALMYGCVEQVAEQMLELAAFGYTDVIVRNLSADQGQALATIERLERVRALVRDA
jgi:alkanesulfonate monooxygenase SsuD/methylene tetrahydromethanopterin reductase-like flavin-dependent oxidoreductase (luciferase family)